MKLRKTGDITGPRVQATDGPPGNVDDLLFDDQSWTVRYLIVDTRPWWPGGSRLFDRGRSSGCDR